MGHKAIVTFEMSQDGSCFGFAEDDRDSSGTTNSLDTADKLKFAIEDMLVKKKKCTKGLVLSGGCHVEVKIEVAQKGGDLFFAHLLRVTLIVEENEAADPVDIGLFGANAVAFHAQVPTDTIQEFGRRSAT